MVRGVLGIHGVLGMCVHAVMGGGRPREIPGALWDPDAAARLQPSVERLLVGWPWRKRTVDRPTSPTLLNTIFLEMRRHVDVDAIRLSPEEGIVRFSPTEAAHFAPAVGTPRERADLYYRTAHTALFFAWRVRDLASVVWCELLHAWNQHAPLEVCGGAGTTRRNMNGGGCGALFFRPRGVIGRWCPVCRALTWRQRNRVYAAPPKERRARALAAYHNVTDQPPFA